MDGLIFVFMFLGAAISASVASGKNRSVIGWMLAGMLFPLISVIIVLCLPAQEAPGATTTI